METRINEIKDLMKELNQDWADGKVEDMLYIQTLNNLMQAVLTNKAK